MPNDQTHQTTRPADALDVMARLESMLDFWRAHVDEFLVQLDLAHMEIRDTSGGSPGGCRGIRRHIWRGGSTKFRRSLAEQREVVAGIQKDLPGCRGRSGAVQRRPERTQ